LKYELENHTLSIKSVQSQINQNECLLDFFESNDKFYVITITKERVFFKECDLTEQQMLPFAQKNDPQNISSLFIQNFVPNWESIKQDIKKIIVIPDGAIWNINFDLLLTQKLSSKNLKNYLF